MSESARATTAAESRFRAPYPNSRARTASLIALDPASTALVARAVANLSERRRVVTLSASSAESGWMQKIEAQAQGLIDDAGRSDMLVMVAAAGCDASEGALLGEACRLRGVPVTALVIAEADTPDGVVARTLAQLRPFSTMIVVANGPDYVEDMLAALRA